MVTNLECGQKTQKTPSAEEMEVQKEIQELETKMLQSSEGSLERLLLEMHLDMKQDNVKMMAKINKATSSTEELHLKVNKLEEAHGTMDKRLKFTQDTQSDEKVRLTQVSDTVKGLQVQVQVLKGLVQKHEQRHLLCRLETEQVRSNELHNNLLISGLDKVEEDDETETTTTKLVTDFFTQTMKIVEPIGIQSAMRIGKGNP